MVKINRIYTRTGDDGTTGLVGGERVAKNSLRVAAYGEVDELNSILGLARTRAQAVGRAELEQKLETIQNELFDLGAELACAPGMDLSKMPTINAEQGARLESWIDQCTDGIPELRSFVLPGGTDLNGFLHLARAVCRRAERTVITLHQEEPVSEPVRVYINRLSDLLFAMARFESHAAGVPEYLWKPGASRPQ